jgi:hypothetical protein
VLMLEIMKEYGFDYYTYMNQPAHIIELATRKFIIESDLAAKRSEQNIHAE